MAQFCDFGDVFITKNSYILKWEFLRGLTREIRKNKTTAKITTYTVFSLGWGACKFALINFQVSINQSLNFKEMKAGLVLF